MENLDLKDRKILYELDIDSRQSFRAIGRKVGLSKDVVASRVKKLQEKGIIEYFFVRTNPSFLGYMHMKIYLRLHKITKDKEQELISDLKKSRLIYWLSSLRGKYDLVVSIYVKNIGDFSQMYEKILGKWGEYILERNVVIHEKAYIYSKAYLIPNQKPKQTVYGEWKEKPVDLDKIDEDLLRYLNSNSRMAIVDIAKQLKLSIDTIRSRIYNLIKKGLITGFGTKIDFRKIGNSYHIITLKLQNMNHNKYKKLEELVKNNCNVIYYIRSIGNHDVELEVETTNKDELEELVTSLRNQFLNEIKDYEILEVIKEHRLSYFPI